nr:hypothetical protein [Tanacetum cinerariifolium]
MASAYISSKEFGGFGWLKKTLQDGFSLSNAALTGCSTFHEPRPVELQKKINSDANHFDQPVESLAAHQVVISSDKYWGMGVVLSKNRVATAAHVVDGVDIGKPITLKYVTRIKERFTYYQSILKYVDPTREIAILELVGEQLPPEATPAFCRHSYGGDKLVSLAPVINGNRMTPVTGLVGYTTNITKLPLVSDAFNRGAMRGGYPPQDAVGQSRVAAIITSDAQHGNSGGALYDADQHCVVGIISLAIPYGEIEPNVRNKLAPSEASNYEGRNLLFAIPITEFSKFY